MKRSGPFRGAQGHSNLRTRTERRGHMNWKRGEVAIRWGNDIHRDQVIRTLPTQVATQQTEHTVQSYTFGGWGWGLGASGLDGPSAFRQHKKPCPPSIRKRCACGFPQGTAEPLRHASNDVYSPPARGLLIHCECPVAGAGAGVECCWKPGGRPKILKNNDTQRTLKRQTESCLCANGPNLS